MAGVTKNCLRHMRKEIIVCYRAWIVVFGSNLILSDLSCFILYYLSEQIYWLKPRFVFLDLVKHKLFIVFCFMRFFHLARLQTRFLCVQLILRRWDFLNFFFISLTFSFQESRSLVYYCSFCVFDLNLLCWGVQLF